MYVIKTLAITHICKLRSENKKRRILSYHLVCDQIVNRSIIFWIYLPKVPSITTLMGCWVGNRLIYSKSIWGSLVGILLGEEVSFMYIVMVSLGRALAVYFNCPFLIKVHFAFNTGFKLLIWSTWVNIESRTKIPS